MKKNIGIIMIVLTIIFCGYLLFSNGDYKESAISIFAAIAFTGCVIVLIFERIISIKIPFLTIQAEIDKIKSDAKEIEEIAKIIKAQKETIDIIIRDANGAQQQISQIRAIASESHLKAQQIEELAKIANEKAEQANGEFKKFEKSIDDAARMIKRPIKGI